MLDVKSSMTSGSDTHLGESVGIRTFETGVWDSSGIRGYI